MKLVNTVKVDIVVSKNKILRNRNHWSDKKKKKNFEWKKCMTTHNHSPVQYYGQRIRTKRIAPCMYIIK